jgi:hypothetical protein
MSEMYCFEILLDFFNCSNCTFIHFFLLFIEKQEYISISCIRVQIWQPFLVLSNYETSKLHLLTEGHVRKAYLDIGII